MSIAKPKEPTVNLRYLDYSPEQNPLLSETTIPLKRRRVKSGLSSKTLVDAGTGEMAATSVIHLIEEKDQAEFVKVFAAGVAASYELSKTGQKVFQAVLQEYERTPMSGGFADCVHLVWFGEGLSGRAISMSEKTFQRGLKELLGKSFLYPKMPNVFWVNPALFFKGDRAIIVKEYRKKAAPERDPKTVDFLEGKADAEK